MAQDGRSPVQDAHLESSKIYTEGGERRCSKL